MTDRTNPDALPDDESLDALIDRVRSGERSALDEIALRHRPVLKRAVRLALNPSNRVRQFVTTKDLVQSVLMRLNRQLGKAGTAGRVADKTVSGFRYLYVIASRLVIDHARRMPPGRRATLPDDIADPAGNAAEARDEAREKWRWVLDRLSPDEREIAAARAAGKTWREIAGPDSVRVERAFQRRIAEIVRLYEAGRG